MNAVVAMSTTEGARLDRGALVWRTGHGRARDGDAIERAPRRPTLAFRLHTRGHRMKPLASLSTLASLLAALTCTTAASAQTPGPPAPDEEHQVRYGGFFSQFELHASFLTDAADRSILNDTFGYAGKLGWRGESVGVFVQGEQNLWATREFERSIVQGALNAGVGMDLLYFERRARSSIALGPSVLLFDSGLDDAGHVGVFVDVRPVGLRWRVHERVTLQADPLTFTVVAPVLEGLPLVNVEYRTVLAVEFDLTRPRRERRVAEGG